MSLDNSHIIEIVRDAKIKILTGEYIKALKLLQKAIDELTLDDGECGDTRIMRLEALQEYLKEQ